jgi:hypothetical protein
MQKVTLIYWKEGDFWLGKLLEHPEIMTQGTSLDELEENIKDAYLMMAMAGVPKKHFVKEIEVGTRKRAKASEHPSFGMWKDRFSNNEVPAFVRHLRKARKGSSLI